MDRQALVDEVRDFFQDSDHWRRFLALLQEPDRRNAHVHSYVYTTVHPDSLEAILRTYFARRGWPIVRRINRIRPRPGIMALHGIEPEGMLHFDFHWLHKKDVGLRPAHGVENGSNLLMWNRTYIEEFNSRFPFLDVGREEEDALRRYFASDHFQKGLDIAARPNVPHVHINVEMSVHPVVVARFAVDAIKRRGWEVYYVCPNAFLLGDSYTGKLVFMGKQPEKVYDLGWQFNPDVVIEPATTPWMFPERVGYDVMTSEEFEDELGQNEYVRLTEAEIAHVLD